MALSLPTIFMDLHGVLVQTPLIFEEYKRITEEQLMKTFNMSRAEAEVRYDTALKRWEDVAFDYLRNPTKSKVGKEFTDFLDKCDKLFPKFLYEELKLTNSMILRTRPFEYAIASQTDVVLYPEVRETLERLKDLGYAMHLASSSHSSHIQGVLEANGIEEYFDDVIGFDSVSATKHTLKFYKTMLHNTCSKAETSVMIGNSIHEVLKPKILGMKTIHINRERRVPIDIRKMANLSISDISLLPIHLDVIELM